MVEVVVRIGRINRIGQIGLIRLIIWTCWSRVIRFLLVVFQRQARRVRELISNRQARRPVRHRS